MRSPVYEHITALESAGAIAAFRRAGRSFPFQWHYHPEYELTLILRSSGTRVVGDHLAPYSDGDLVLIGPNLPHTWESEGTLPRGENMLADVMQFRLDRLGADLLAQPELARIRRLLQEGAPRGVHWPAPPAAVQAGMRAIVASEGLERLLQALRLLDLLAGLPDCVPLCSPDYSPQLAAGDRLRLERVTDHIHEHFRSPLRLGDVAAVAHMSPSHFSRYFKKATRMTFVSYVNHLRIGWASRQLLESEQTIAHVAYAAGFNNLANFNRRFKDVKGMSPSQYLRRFRH